MSFSTNPNTDYLRLLAAAHQQGLVVAPSLQSNPCGNDLRTLSLLSTLAQQHPTNHAPAQQHPHTNHDTSYSANNILQNLLKQKIAEEEQCNKAAALLALARNVSPDLVALALLRKQQQQEEAATQQQHQQQHQHQLQEQIRRLEVQALLSTNAQSALRGAFVGRLGIGGRPLTVSHALQQAIPNSSASSGSGVSVAVPNPPIHHLSPYCSIAAATATTTHSSTSTHQDGKNAGAFPRKLHQMLKDLQKSDQADIASFIAGGLAFHIHDPKDFADKIMPKYFRMGRFSSFQRQLNLYCFERIAEGPHKGGYYHEMFVEARPGLTALMKRIKIKGRHQVKNQVLHLQNQREIQQAGALAPKMAAAGETPSSHPHKVYDDEDSSSSAESDVT